MKTKSFAFAILRLLSIWIFVKYVVINLFSTATFIFSAISGNNYGDGFLSYSFLLPLLLLIIWATVSWFLWFKADGISNKLIISSLDENNIESFDAEKIVNVALTILGFYFILQSIPEIIGNLVHAFYYNPLVSKLEKTNNIVAVINPLVTLFIGLICIMKTNNLKLLFYKLRSIGN